MHRTIEPSILYFGTPVALITSTNPDGSTNLAPMSSAWWLGWTCMLGLGQMGQTSDNLIRTRECVINLPSQELVAHVDRLASENRQLAPYPVGSGPEGRARLELAQRNCRLCTRFMADTDTVLLGLRA